ncbi:2-oxoglutarate dehydrogenase, E2 component, dihydrolipoamide succinyltransferase [Actinobaculum massiliense]|uniref:Dihydrolipoamide acetyltransferase component of pyruvate dehydrogenase complex n=1 Tax=Actinobaculum massiliense ACS-171-V-Col2 TaxID=883066 RepID=K9EYD3_9ACTO|nr:2-oxoglutarate dehydrogenase, E2 component, dihydrolipoamide succinyltransferase [Actinobaculum massiliense]EKU95982.1 2-oxoglutarate dehydrogenase, E2 component, dihydrolipoamide succinyltransferase [Actinobaculum massiliense ACS-171-V-Col2]MDK8318268.1 2-oxoglutarate dehydrogenase, E2 component, dihydrolipoamide succinyltransferase [Actinobaculum massiliense]MDK8566683.1 2-oxoglutarate dehydrogenase, E2 component, dihydrolipoamide succinyltransferase [Actinobaculum massiliense]
MSEPIKMPALGESVDTGTVTSWLKNVGDTVSLDEPILEVSTDKVDSEVPSPAEGILEQILVQEDEEVEVGTVLGYIGDGSGAGTRAEEAPAASTPAGESAAVPASQDHSEAESEQVQQAAEQSAGGPAPAGGDAVEVKMPALGESVDEGTVTSWLVEEGEEVSEGDALLEVSTDKVDSEVPAPASGTLQKILVQEDETVAVGTVLAYIGDGAAPAAPAPAEPAPAAKPAEAPAAPKHAAPEAPAAPAAPAPQETAAAAEPDAYITPIVRKLARELAVDLSKVDGSGVGGRIRRQDVEEAAKKAKEATVAPQAQPAPAAKPAAAAAKPSKPVEGGPDDPALRGTTQKMSRLRQTIAKRMVDSLQVSAQLTTVIKVDVTNLVAVRQAQKNAFQEREGTKLTYLPFFVKAAVDTLKSHPTLNARVSEDEKTVEYFDHENIGIAVDTPKGLFVPVIKNAGDLNIAGIAKAINEGAAKVRDGKASVDDLSGGTFTITNTGGNGVMFDTPVINQPEVAILGIGGIMREPGIVKAADGSELIGIRSYLYPAISYDHRLVDGAVAGRFLKDFKNLIENTDFTEWL